MRKRKRGEMGCLCRRVVITFIMIVPIVGGKKKTISTKRSIFIGPGLIYLDLVALPVPAWDLPIPQFRSVS